MKLSAKFWVRSALVVLLCGSVSGFIIAKDQTESVSAPLVIKIDKNSIDRKKDGVSMSYASMLENATKSVVSVHTAELVKEVTRGGMSMEDMLLRRFFGHPIPRGNNQAAPETKERKVPQGVGSGVIISEDGYILTNSHVVQDSRGGDADEIKVRLFDSRELEATLIGRDPKTDIAIIKVDAKDLHVATIADSDNIKVGDKVFAIGNPLGIGLTVTSGIVSAKNRAIGIYGQDGYENFIQTDAPINQGNSGGALVDIEGRVIGINSAIVSRNGGSVGLGFAIPTNLAVNISEQLTASGEVKRGVIGVRISHLDTELSKALGVADVKGVLVQQVEAGMPAEKAGVKHGDIITHVNGKAVQSPRELRLAIAKVTPGDKAEVSIQRGSDQLNLTIKVGDPSSMSLMKGELFSGVKVAPVDNTHRSKYGIPPSISGLVIDEISKSSNIYGKLAEGTVIMEINRNPVRTIQDANKAIRKKDTNLLYIYSRGMKSYVAYTE